MAEIAVALLYKHDIMKWISVKDRLPDMEVLAANFSPGTYGFKEMKIGYVGEGESGNIVCEDDNEILFPITHWMPLPKPPK